MTIHEIYKKFEELADRKNLENYDRFGINKPEKAFGIKIPYIKKLAQEIGKDQELALQLWKEDCHEAKILASLIADPKLASEALLDNWVKDLYSWDICDTFIMHFVKKTSNPYEKAKQWSKRNPEFEKRAGFALMASLAITDKKMDDNKFQEFFPFILEEATDERNFVKKAVNWAIRQIGKRSMYLNKKALELCYQLKNIDSKSSKWIAFDAIRELKNEKTLKNIRR